MSFVPRSAKISLRFVFVIAIIAIMSVAGFASGWETVAGFASELTTSARVALFGTPEELTADGFLSPTAVNKTVCGTGTPDFATLAAAVTDANTNFPTGGVTYNVCAGFTETAPAGGYVVNSQGSAGNEIIFQKDPATSGANPIFTASAALTAGSLTDGIFKIIGGDFVTIDGFTLQENSANLTTTAASNNMTEWGVAFLYASTTNGAQNNTIKNSSITLNKAYLNTFGIYSNVRHSATAIATTADITSPTGSNSGNKIYGNTISNVNMGIAFIGSGTAANQDTGNDVGGNSAATGNTITNWGGAAAASGYISNSGTSYCIFFNHQTADNISFNTLTSAAVSGTSVTFVGIRKDYSTTSPIGTFTSNITNNTITMTSGFTSGTFQHILSQNLTALATATININDNTFLNSAVTGASSSSTIVGIQNSSAPGTLSISNNVIRGITSTATTGGVTGFSNSGAVVNTINLNNNQLGNATSGFATFSAATSGAVTGISNTGGATTATLSMNSNNIQGITHSVAATSAHTYFTNTATGPATNMNSNTFTNLNVNTTGSVTFISNSVTHTAGTTHNANNNSIVTAFNKLGAGGTVQFFLSNSSSGSTVIENSTGNNFSNVTVAGATIIAGWQNSDGGSPVTTVTNNTFSNITGGTGSITVLNCGFSGNGNCSGNTISNVSSGGGIIGFASTSGTQNIFGNTISALATTGASSVTGISISGGTAQNIFKNKIFDLQANNASGTVAGITVSAGTTTNVYNNLIGDLRTPAANAANPLIGLNITGGTTVNAYFNTVFLNGSSTGALFGSSAVSVSSTPTVTLRNNIFVNNSSVTGAGLAVAHRRSSTTLTTYAAASNNNDFFGSTIFTDGTNTDATIANYKARVSSRDTVSFAENPAFTSTTGSSPNFLHISLVTPTQLESGGATVSGVTDDFDGETRNASTPDIGADEFAGVGLDLSPPSISYTALAATASLTNRTLAATVTDASGVAASPLAPRVYFKKSTDVSYVSTECAGVAPSYNCSIDYSLVGGGSVAGGDTIQYFVVAQDVNGNLGANPAAGFSGSNVNTVTTPPTTPSSYLITPSISGSKTVGAGGDYPTLTAAVAAINASEVTGPLTLTLTDASYSAGETFPLTINANAGSSTTNTITLKPAATISPVISGSNATCILALAGADWVTVDGSNTVGGTTKNLTISNTNTSGGTVCLTNSATNNIVKNSVVTGVTTSTSNGVVFVATTATGTVGNNNNTFANNDLSGGATAPAYVFFNLGTAAAKNTATTLVDNRVFNFSNTGIRDDGNSAGAVYTHNEIFEQTAQTSALTGFRPSATSIDGFTFTRNYIHDLNTSTTTSVYGIHLFDTSTVATSEVSNNAITLSPTTPLTLRGIYDQTATGEKYNVYFNSVYLGGTVTGVSNSEAYYWSIASTTNARNNIFVNARTGGTGKHYAYRLNTTLANIVSDYNDIYATGGTANVFGNDGTADRADIAAWRTATSKDTNSKSVDPLFVSVTDLHIQSTSPVESQGIAIAGVTVDFDGETRPSTPDIGADEVTPAPPGTIQFSSPSYSAAEGTLNVTLTVTRTGGSFGAVTANYALSGSSATGGAACLGGVDFLDAGGSVTFADGDAADKTFTVTVCDDAAFDPSETFSATLSIGSGTATLGTPALSTVLITDNDTAPTLQFSQANYGVGEIFASTTLTVTRTGATDNAASATYQTASNSATGGASCASGVDFVNQVGTVNFAAGELTKDIVVTLCPDSLYEGDEMFSVALSAPFGVTVLGAPSSANVIINENDIAPTFQFSSAVYTNSDDIAKNTGGADQFAPTVATITVTRDGATDNAVEVGYATVAGGTATGGVACGTGSGVDYVPTGGTLAFAAGEVSKNFAVTVCTDSLFEGDETVNLALSNPTAPATLGTINTSVLTITDNDAQPSLQFSSATYTNSDDIARFGVTTDEFAPSVATITVTRTGAVDNAVGVSYATGGGTATSGPSCVSGVDYLAASGTLIFAAGEVSKDFAVTVCTDALFEGDETVSLVLSNPTGSAALGTPNTATLTISDNDPQPTLQFSSATYAVNESSPTVTVTVNRTGAPDNVVTVGYLTNGGTATAGGGTCAIGEDYTSTSGLLTFAAGELSKTFTVAICDDAVAESPEAFGVALNAPSGGAVLGAISTATVTISDNDAADYIVTTTGNAIVITDTKDNGDSVTINEPVAGNIGVSAAGRTFQVDGGAVSNGFSGNLPLAGVTSVTFNGQGGADTIAVGGMSGSFPSLTINGGTGSDVVNFNGAINFAAGANLDVDLQNDDPAPGVDVVNVNAGAILSLAGSGSATIKSSQSVNVNGQIAVVDGNLTVEANQQATATVGNFRGVTINTGGLTTSGTGAISVKGKGGSAAVNSLRGILITGGFVTSTSSAANAGTITLSGTGGTGLASNRGVEIFNNPNAVTTVTGDISITGIGGAGATTQNSGVQIGGAGVRSTGSAKITIEGTGGAGTSGQAGVRIVNAGAEVTSAGGDITINGFGGTAVSGTGNHGVSVGLSALIAATNGAKISAYGVAGGGTGSSTGLIVALADASAPTLFAKVTSDSGNISLTGVGGSGAGGGNIGVNVNSGGSVQGTGAANVSITGTGGTGGDDNYGIDLESADTAGTSVSTVSGTLTLNGTATDTNGLRQNGIRFEDSVAGQVFTLSSISGNVTLTASSASSDPSSRALTIADDTNFVLNGTVNTLNADTIDIGTSQVALGGSNYVIKPLTPGIGIDIGGADTATRVGLTDAELDTLNVSNLTIGSATTGNIVISSVITRPTSPVMRIVSGADIGINSGYIENTGASVTYDAAGFLYVPNAGVDSVSPSTIVASGRTLRFAIGPTTPDTGYSQFNVEGGVTITGVTLSLDGLSLPTGGEVYTIIKNDGTDAVVGTFAGLPEGATISNIVGSGLNATISYVGGTGNDVVITVATPPSSIQLSAATASVSEANPSVSLTVTRTGSTILPASVNYSTAGTTASGDTSCTTGVDYTDVSGTLNFASGETSKSIVVPICADTEIETNEQFTVVLSGIAGAATLGTPSSATVTITNDDFDTTPPTVTYTPLTSIPAVSNRTFNVTATDNIGVTGVTIVWANNGGSGGSLVAPCSFVSGTTWSCTITANVGSPAQTSPGTVSYFVSANDAAGNSSSNPAGGTLNAGTRNLFTVGSGGTIDVGTINTFDSMIVGSGFTLNGNATVNGSLTLGGGTLLTGANRLILGCNATVGGAGGNNYVIGTVEKQFCGAGAFSFPLGTVSDGTFQGGVQLAPEGSLPEFTPVDVNVTSVTMPASLVATVTDGVMLGSDAAQSASRYWDIQLVGGPLTADLTMHYLDQDVVGNEANYRVLRRSSSTLIYPGGVINPAANTAFAPAVSAFSLWGAGNFVPTAAAADISGTVRTSSGEGIRNATVVVSGGGLIEPITVKTTSFGKYRVAGLPAGQVYVVTIVSNRYQFDSASRVVNLQDSVLDEDFTALPQ